jgi:DNA-binding response OmpR family regulator
MIEGEGQEVLIVDGDPKVQKGIEHLFRSAGLTPTVIADPQRAIEVSGEKFFAVAVVDLDTPVHDGGLAVLQALRARSPKTALVALSPRRAFDGAVAAFRAGVDDVIVKAPDQVELLRDRVVELALGRKREAEASKVLEQAGALHEDLMKVLLDMHRRVTDLEEGVKEGDSDLDEITSVLLVEDDGWLAGQLSAMLGETYELESVSTGGEALDLAGRNHYHLALVKDSLPDLPGSMVVRTVKTQSPETIVLSFSSPLGGRPGSVQVVETTRSIPFLPTFTEPQQIVDRIDELRDAFHATAKERKYLASFRQQHFDLLKRYADLKQRLVRARV